MSGQESTSTSASASASTSASTSAPVPAPTPEAPTNTAPSFASSFGFKSDPLQDVYDAYFTDISNNDNLDAYRLYEYKRCIDYINKNKKATKLLDKMRETVIKILKNTKKINNLPIDINLQEKISNITNDLMAKSFLNSYKPDEKMITIKSDDDSKSLDEEKKKFLPIIEIAATDEDFAKNVVLLGTTPDDYEIKMMKMEGLQWTAMEKIVWDVSKTPPKTTRISNKS